MDPTIRYRHTLHLASGERVTLTYQYGKVKLAVDGRTDLTLTLGEAVNLIGGLHAIIQEAVGRAERAQ